MSINYSGPRWRALRLRILERGGWALRPMWLERSGKAQARVDHIEPVGAQPDLPWSADNLHVLHLLRCAGPCRERHRRQGARLMLR